MLCLCYHSQLILTLRAHGLKTAATGVCDGAGENRAWQRLVLNIAGTPDGPFKLHFDLWCLPLWERIYCLSDPSHLIKKFRSNLNSSGFSKKRLLAKKVSDTTCRRLHWLLKMHAYSCVTTEPYCSSRWPFLKACSDLLCSFAAYCDSLYQAVNPATGRAERVPVCLSQLRAVWEVSAGYNQGLTGDRKLELDNFVLTSLNKMNVSKSARVFSRTMAQLIEDLMREFAGSDKEVPWDTENCTFPAWQLEPLLELCRLINAWFDAMNSRVTWSTGDRITKRVHYTAKVNALSLTDQHGPVQDIKALLDFLQSWWSEIDKESSEFSPADKRKMFFAHDKCWFDAQLTLKNTLELLDHYLKLPQYAGARVQLRSLSQDILEHHFANVRRYAGDGDPSYSEFLNASYNAGVFRVVKDATGKSNSGNAPVAESQPLPARHDMRRVRRVQQKEREAASTGLTPEARYANRTIRSVDALIVKLQGEQQSTSDTAAAMQID